MLSMESAVDNCPERMDAADAEAPRPLRIETTVEFCPRAPLRIETVVEVCLGVQSMTGSMGALLAIRRCFWCTRKTKKNKQKQKQEAGG